MLRFARLATFLTAAATAQQCGYQGSAPIGEPVPTNAVYTGDAPFTTTLTKAGATYAAVHFKSIDVPADGKLTLTSADGKESVVFPGGTSATNVRADWLSGASVGVTYEAPAYTKHETPIFVIDEVTYGKQRPVLEALCGPDHSKPAACYAEADPVKYKAGKSVARLIIGGRLPCTGWLVGSEGHLLTNNHCVGSADDAKDVQVELGAECATCSDKKNQQQLGCKGTIVATSGTFVATSEESDFTLLKLNVKEGVDLKQWGYLQVREDGPKLNETIHILGHPASWPKRFSIVGQDDKPGFVTTTSFQSACRDDEFGYRLDTQGGSSGSPVISTEDNLVVGLHNCGGCPDYDNAGIKINNVLAILKAQNAIPKDAIGSGKPAC